VMAPHVNAVVTGRWRPYIQVAVIDTTSERSKFTLYYIRIMQPTGVGDWGVGDWGVRGASAPQKFSFGENPGKIL